MASTQVALETHLKSTLHALSLVISFYSSLQALSATSYVTHAPRHLTQQLHAESAKYDAVCAEVEKRILYAIATIRRDALKASGQPLLAASPGPAVDAALSTADAPQADDVMMDDSFLNTSLFGDSPANSRPRTATSQSGLDSAISAGQDVANAIAGLGSSSLLSANGPTPTSTAAGPSLEAGIAGTTAGQELPNDDFASLMSMLNSSSAPGDVSMTVDAGLPNFGVSGDLSSTSGGGDIDINAMLSMLSSAAPASGAAATSNTDGGTNDLSTLDFGALGDGAEPWDQSSIDDLLKQLGDGA